MKGGQTFAGSAASPAATEPIAAGGKYELDERDKEIVRVLQDDFPLVSEPYKEMAARVGISENDFLDAVRRFDERGLIRKMGAVLQHREVGYGGNVLCAWEVPPSRLDEIAAYMSTSPAVTHCYDRTTAPGWPYNLYTMIHAHSRGECEMIASRLADATGVTNRAMLHTKREWKKTSMKYFCE